MATKTDNKPTFTNNQGIVDYPTFAAPDARGYRDATWQGLNWTMTPNGAVLVKIPGTFRGMQCATADTLCRAAVGKAAWEASQEPVAKYIREQAAAARIGNPSSKATSEPWVYVEVDATGTRRKQPLDLIAVPAMLADGRLTPDSLVWTPAFGPHWHTLRSTVLVKMMVPDLPTDPPAVPE